MTSLITPSESKSEPEIEPLSERNQQKAHVLGLSSATALVVGSIVGTGVFTMPRSSRERARWASPFSP